jgi:hypothetical protein
LRSPVGEAFPSVDFPDKEIFEMRVKDAPFVGCRLLPIIALVFLFPATAAVSITYLYSSAPTFSMTLAPISFT